MAPPQFLRQGPRPLPLHLANSWMSYVSSMPASLLWNSGLPILSGQNSQPAAEALRAALDSAGAAPEEFAAAVELAARRRLGRFLTGVRTWRDHPYRRPFTDPPVLWQQGEIRLLDYAPRLPPGAPVLLAVPSLINRAYVLDLMPGRSLMRWLAEQGIRPLLLDWGAPGEACRDYTLTDYICGPLEEAVLRAARLGPVTLLGYCMGGLLAVAGAQQGWPVRRLALLATPWNFQADAALARRLQAALPLLGGTVELWDGLPVDVLQMLFAGIDPGQVAGKFAAFARIDPASPQAQAFVALEDWLNDGVPLAAPVARECLTGWYGRNTPHLGRWRVAGRAVRPEACSLPSLVMIPARDRIVPPDSAAALAAALPHAVVHQVPLGHIGMVVAGGAPRYVWQPIKEWVAEGRG